MTESGSAEEYGDIAPDLATANTSVLTNLIDPCNISLDRLQATTGDLEVSITLPSEVDLRQHPKVPVTIRNATAQAIGNSDHDWWLLWTIDGRVNAVTAEGGGAKSGRRLAAGEVVTVARGISFTGSCADRRSLPAAGVYQVYYLQFSHDEAKWAAFRATNPPSDSESAPAAILAAVSGPHEVELIG